MELKILALSIVLGILHIMIAAQAATKRRGVKWNLSSREAQLPELDGMAGRLGRASKNFQETFPFFVAAVLATQLLGISNTMTVIGAQAYFYARLVYLPLYAFDVIGIRTIAWVISLIGLLMVLAGLF